MEEDEIDFSKIPPEKKYQYIVVFALIALFIMGFSAGDRLGYIQGYNHVQGWYETYINQSCSCSGLKNVAHTFDVPEELKIAIT